jgi:multicomponent Na+:H+ antiporter subunit B
MIKRVFAIVLVAGFAWIFYLAVTGWQPKTELSGVAYDYVKQGADELGAMNLVTAIVVTYRGLDTLGEVTVLFLASTGVAVLLRRKEDENVAVPEKKRRESSEFIQTGTGLLVPVIVMFGAYIFLNGHLSPGGGFQGGAVVASAVLLMFLAKPDHYLNNGLLNIIESFSGFGYVLIGILGIFLAGGFLDNRILPLGDFGKLLSAGAIPVIYTLIGLKVGTELAGILENLKGLKS